MVDRAQSQRSRDREPTTPGILIAAPASGTGKTTITTGLIAALSARMSVAPFKVGPDYIDPGYHGLAAGRTGRNLDMVMCGADLIGPLYRHGSSGCDIAVVEGVMGLFDGRIPDGLGSSADIARLLGLPVILVVDIRGMSQSVGALVRGFATADKNVRIAGVILNMVGSERHRDICTQAVEYEGIPVVGAIPRQDAVAVPSRHLGLVTATEHGHQAAEAIAHMADLVDRYCDTDAIAALASTSYSGPSWNPAALMERGNAVTVAIASGPAFNFSYAEHRELLAAAGARVVEFDPLVDELPSCEGIIIPGGFPEEYADILASRDSLREDIRRHIAAKKPVHGECAGLLWLVDRLDERHMLGAIPVSASMKKRLTLGYRSAVALGDNLLCRAGQRITGHEFHHSGVDQETAEGFDPAWAWQDYYGNTKSEGFTTATVHASYLHTHPAAYPEMVQRFIQACQRVTS
ncbi:cobyrinate a,c-diamide synthase [Corynebacterium sp. ES2715-CONJ3]|uniref:cobyrinate a,c-diamide synthase n=1 Tax=Corynebacterium sp. ES2715-CONJ3 TaxID=2974028 RepID=UPI0021674AAB|nr:cobyrinate a,c-diamide synthase [Corynebacterium sp. ES2715-CONJ3]MCS4490926.1 cobyrinate a,c-diamide synthase [Corynebacterium sp. ES2715-CONJ3]